MRIAALLAASLLIAGCSHQLGGHSEPASSPTQPSGQPASAPGSKASAPASAPAPGAAISAIITWIEAGHAADPARFHIATREGAATQLGDDIAFSSQAGKVTCTTDAKHTPGTLSCLVDLASPPPRPDTAYGEFKGGWVDFDGVNLQVGAARGDPGPFVNGNGPQLADGDTLSFGDYRCRADAAGAFCVNYAHQSAARFSSAGIEPFGCLRPGPPPDGVGVAFRC